MKAIQYSEYGPPEVLGLTEIEKPVPGDNEVLIKIQETVVTPADCVFREGSPFVARLAAGLFKPKHNIPGVELAGIVEATGKDVKNFKPGDQVFGSACTGYGAHAEFKCLPEDQLDRKPVNMSYGQAAALVDGGLTALIFLRDTAKVQSGQKVLINGASGSVGSFAVQLAKHYGAEVTGVCGSNNVEFVKSLGADFVIDYTREDFTKNDESYDIIFDTVGKSSFSRSKGALTKKGTYLSTVLTAGIVFQMFKTCMFSRKKAKFAAAGLQHSKANLIFLRELAEAGKLKANIDRYYPLEEIVEAHRYVETGRKKGGVVLTLEHNPVDPTAHTSL